MSQTRWATLSGLATGSGHDWTSANLFRCDPYLVWADAVTQPGAGKELNIAVLVELTNAADYDAFRQRMNSKGNGLDDLRFLPNGFEPGPATRFITGLVNRPGLEALILEVVTGSIERFSLQNSREDIAETMQVMWLRITKESLQEKALRASPASSARAGPAASTAKQIGTYLGIIDDGLPFLRVRDAVQLASPPAHLWDQGWRQTALVGTQVNPGDPPAPDDKYWRLAWEGLPSYPFVFSNFRGFLYGRRLKELPPPPAGGPSREVDEYFLSRYFAPAPRKTHGAAVLGLMAPWLSGARMEVTWPDHISGLAMVQLPTSTVRDTSGGSLAMRVIDGLRYILWQEAHDRGDHSKERPVLVNVSYGNHAGPHDGTSMFERALSEMLDTHRHLHVVLPVGNGAQAGCHAQRVLASKNEPGSSDVISMEVLPDNGRDTFVEIWAPRGSKVALHIRPPGSPVAFKIEEGEARIHFDPVPGKPDEPQTVHFGAVYSAEVAQGTNRAMVLLAIGPTRRLPRPTRARGLNQQLRRETLGSPGLWQLTVENLTDEAVTVDAWAERDDAPPDLPTGKRQAYFPDSCCDGVRLGNSTPENTVNGIATLRHNRLHVVGAMRTDGALSDYSAAGADGTPTFRDGPDVVAPADCSKNRPGLRTMGFLRGSVARINGTSAACAVYTRTLACELASGSTSPCSAPVPGNPPPELTCVPESQPQADPLLRGQDKRRLFPFGIEL